MFYLKLLTIFILVFIGFASVSTAQAQNAGLLVKVSNQLDESIGGAEIKLVRTGAGAKQSKTDKQGNARFSDLPDGEYKIFVVAVGFKQYESEPVIIEKSADENVSIILEIAPVESKVVVGDDEADTDNFGGTRVLKQEMIDKLPDNPADMERVLRQIAGQSVTGEDLPITVDGFPAGQLPPKQAIQQIRVNQNIFSAQYEGPYGGGIEIFTKSDIQKFSGGVSLTFADSRLNAANPFVGQKLPSQNRGYKFFLTGPLASKKASFQFYASRSENDSSVAVNAVTLDSVFQPIEYRGFFANPSRADNLQLYIKADPTKKHKLAFNYFFDRRKSAGQGVGDFALASRAYAGDYQNHTIQISDTYLANENTVSQTRFQMLYSKSKNFGGASEAAVNVLDAFSGGGAQIDDSNNDLRFEFSNDTTRQMGKYGLGFGWKIRGQRVSRISKSNFGGTYTFAGRLAPFLDANNNPATDAGGNVVREQISSLESYRRTLLFRRLNYSNQQIRNLGGGASQFTISGGNPEFSASQYDVGLYVQNSYKVNKQFALSFGVRYENQTNIDSGFNFSPRFGVVWSPKADKKKSALLALPKISAGVGMFYSRFGIGNILSVGQAAADKSQYFINDGDALDTFPVVPSIDALERFALPRIERFIDADAQTPLQGLFNINISKKLPSDFSINFSYSRTNGARQQLSRNINAPLAGTFDSLNPDSAVYPSGKEKGFVYRTSSEGKSRTDWFNFVLYIPSRKYLQTEFRYNFGKSKNDLVGGGGSPFDADDFSREYGFDQRDGRHSVGFTASSELPFGVGVTNFFNFASGTRFNIFTGRDTNGDGFFTERPAFASDLTKPNLVKTEYGILDPNPSPTDAIVPRNLARGPATFNLDTIFDKSFGFGAGKNSKQSRYSINISVYVRNILNINNKGNPIGNMASPNFLRQTSYNSDASNIVAASAGTFSGFGGRSFNFYANFRF